MKKLVLHALLLAAPLFAALPAQADEPTPLPRSLASFPPAELARVCALATAYSSRLLYEVSEDENDADMEETAVVNALAMEVWLRKAPASARATDWDKPLADWERYIPASERENQAMYCMEKGIEELEKMSKSELESLNSPVSRVMEGWADRYARMKAAGKTKR